MRSISPETDTQYRSERKWRAIQRLIGSSILGTVAAWKILTYEPVPHLDGEPHQVHWLLIAWIGLAVLSFGIASWDQIMKAVRG